MMKLFRLLSCVLMLLLWNEFSFAESSRESISSVSSKLVRIVPEESDAVQHLQVDAIENCFFLDQKNDPQDKAIRHPLNANQTYTIRATGEAFLSSHKGNKADPFPGVVLFYCSNEQDGYATQTHLLKSGESLTFTTPKRKSRDLFLSAFFIDYWSKSKNRGGFDLEIQKVSKRSENGEAIQSSASNVLNINFAYEPENENHRGVIGKKSDHWNFVDYGQRILKNVRTADGTTTDIEVEISENDGEWGIAEQAGIFHGYIYHNCQCVDLSVTLNYLPTGIYEMYVFAHGDAPNQNAAIEIESNGVAYSGKKTLNDGSWNFRSEAFEEGNQYVRYVIDVTAGEPVKITSKRDGSDYSMFNAIQLKKLN